MNQETSKRETHNHFNMASDSSWEANRINILTSQDRIETTLRDVVDKLSVVSERVAGLDSKFDRYNGFNDKLAKQDAKIDALNDTVVGLVVKLSWLVALIAAGATIIGNYVIQLFGK